MENMQIITTLAIAFFSTWLFGLTTYYIGLSPMVGYLCAGYLLGPHTPWYVADKALAQQFADIGIIFLMFGVGLHFHFQDLYKVRWIAIPGAISQSTIATILGALIFSSLGLPMRSAVILGMSISVASTVVLTRVLQDCGKLETRSGHVAMGWLIVEDIIAVVFLILLPIIAGGEAASDGSSPSLITSLSIAFLKLAALIAIVVVAGSRIVPSLMVRVAKLRSREMFTLTVLVFSVTVASASAYFFGASTALGAFLAGMLVGQSPASHQAASDALPLQDTFAVLFFVSVGMLLDPAAIMQNPYILLGTLLIILIVKPIFVLGLITFLGHPFRTALTVALGLTQIGEFSFILAGLAHDKNLIPDTAYSSLVATAIICISLNPIIFKLQMPIENVLKKHPRIWGLLNHKALKRIEKLNKNAVEAIQETSKKEDISDLAIIVGFGVVGQGVCSLLRKSGLETVVIDINMGTISRLNESKELTDYALYGDASSASILKQAGINRAKYLIITMAMATNPAPVIAVAKELNPAIRVLVRGRFVGERELLERSGATSVVFDEAETAIAMGSMIIEELDRTLEEYADDMKQIRASVGL